MTNNFRMQSLVSTLIFLIILLPFCRKLYGTAEILDKSSFYKIHRDDRIVWISE